MVRAAATGPYGASATEPQSVSAHSGNGPSRILMRAADAAPAYRSMSRRLDGARLGEFNRLGAAFVRRASLRAPTAKPALAERPHLPSTKKKQGTQSDMSHVFARAHISIPPASEHFISYSAFLY